MKLKIPPKMMMFLLEKLAEIEVRLSSGSSEKLNLGALVGAFQLVRQQVFSQSNATVSPMDTL